MSINLCSLPDEFLFLVTNKLYFHELCRLRRTCRSFDSFVEKRRHRYTIRSRLRLFFIYDEIPDGSRIQDMNQGEVIVSLPSKAQVYLADPYSQLSAVYFTNINFFTYFFPMKSEKLIFPPGKMHEKSDCFIKKEDDVLRVIDLDIVNLLSRMRLRCQNFNFMPRSKERNYWLYLSTIKFRHLTFGISPSDPMFLTIDDLKRLASMKCTNIIADFSNVTEEVFNVLGAFTHVMMHIVTHGSTSWLHSYLEKLLAGWTCSRLKELCVSLWRGDERILSRWMSNPNFVELFKSEELAIYLLTLPNNQFAFLSERLLRSETTKDLSLAFTDLSNLWTCLQQFPCCLYRNRPIDFSSLVGNSLEQTIEKYQTFFRVF